MSIHRKHQKPIPPSPRPEPADRRVVWAVAWLLGYAAVFYTLDLPNSHPPMGRWYFWVWLPELLYGNFVALPGALPGSWSNLPQRLDLMLVAAAVWISGWAIGSLFLRALKVPAGGARLDRLVLACGVGISTLSQLTLIFGQLGWLSLPSLAGVLLIAFLAELGLQLTARCNRTPQAAAGRSTIDPRRAGQGGQGIGEFASPSACHPWEASTMARIVTFLGLGAFLLAMILGSLLPPTDFDVKTYHLTGPKEYFQNGRITFLPHNVYTSFPFLTEMLALLAMVLRQDWYRGALAGQAVIMGFVPLTALALFCAGRRSCGERTGWMAAIIYLTNPWSYRLAIIPYVEGALSCYTLLALCAGLMAWQSLADEDRNAQAAWRWFLLTGWFAGSAMACKYPGLVSVVIPLGAATVLAVGHCRGWFGTTRNAGHNGPSPPSRSWTPLFAFAVGFAVTMGPWLVKNLVETGNPVYPLAYRLFGGADWNAELDARWTAAHRPPHYDLADLGRRFLEVTIRSDWLSPLLFGLAPLAALAVAARRPPWLVRGLWLYVGYLFATWWLLTHRLDRFWVPLLPFVAWLAGIGATWTASAIWITIRQSVVLLALLFNLGYITTSQCGLSAYLVDLDAARQFCEGTVEPVQYLNFLVASGRLAPDSKVLLVGESQAFDARVSLLYNTAFDQPLFDRLFAAPPDGTDPPDTMPANWPLRPAADIRRELADQGITHVMVSWEAILRYRTEVGYSDFVTLANVKQLVRMGLLRHNDSYPQGLRDYDAASAPIRREIDRWAPELRATRRGQNVFVAWQLWETAVDGR